METLLLQGKSKKDISLLKSLAEKIGIRAHTLSMTDIEDIAIANAMKQGRTGKYVNTANYLKKLKDR